MALTTGLTYQNITWGTKLKAKDHYTFYPLYDWSYRDIWKYIHDNKVNYCKIYDELYRHQVNIREMRISNLHHETAIQSLLLVQEIEPQTWNKIAERIDGANTIKHIRYNSFTCPKELPYMFKDWEEYAMHLAGNIIQEEKYYNLFMKHVESNQRYNQGLIRNDFWRSLINTILSSDWDFTKFQNWRISGAVDTFRRFHFNPQGKDKVKFRWMKTTLKGTKYLTRS